MPKTLDFKNSYDAARSGRLPDPTLGEVCCHTLTADSIRRLDPWARPAWQVLSRGHLD